MKMRHGGNVGPTPFYLFEGQCDPEYDQGHSVVVWYDDLVLKQEDIDKEKAAKDAAEATIARLRALSAKWRGSLRPDRGRFADDLDAALASLPSSPVSQPAETEKGKP